MKKDSSNSTVRVLRAYFNAAFAIALLTAVGAGILIAENGTRSLNGISPDSAVLSSADRRVELLFQKSSLSLRFDLPERSLFSELLPPPLGNFIWLARSLIDAAK